MATIIERGPVGANPEQSERRFFAWLAVAMALVIVVGFSLNLGMGRSTFAVPLAYHMHAVVFFAWVLFYVAQGVTIARETLARVRERVAGVQVSAPLGRVDLALQVFEGMTSAVAAR